MVGVSTALTSGLGWLVYRFHAEASRVVAIRALDPDDAEAQALGAALKSSEWRLVASLVAFAVVLAAVLAVWQIVGTHRFVGPLYYLERECGRIRAGQLSPMRPLRKHDLLHRFFEAFRAMQEALRTRTLADADRLAALAADAEKAGAKEVASALRELVEERRKQLAG